ncbi:armadillo-type protein [Papiliotrema laurentii]|uniref:Armadillo-type protein n=1 Tax=Papiliotrema laurentii TaxID=5418 RepID=A0AAD9CZ69_PAPLA|nr:armadillo-type protein [Papiliotrema laurentii]
MDQHVLECLSATLAADEQTRHAAEQQLNQLFLHPEGGLSLARLLLSPEVDIAQRQSAGVLLQKYISKHWSSLSMSYEPPSTTPEVKAQIRPIIFQGLSDPIRKVRSASAFALSTIGKYDWPEDYPTLLDDLVRLLSGSADSVHGAMRVISEFVKNELSEDQLLPVVRDLAPALLNILGNPQAHSPATRASTVNVFRQVVRMLETVKDEHPQAVKQALDGLCPAWFGAFQQLLAQDPAQEVAQSWESIGIRIEIFRTFQTFFNAFPKVITSNLTTYIPLAIHNLQSLLPLFTSHYVSTGSNASEPPSPTSDAGFVTPTNGIDDLACTIFDFLTPAVRHQKALALLVSGEKGSEQGSDTLRQVLDLVLRYTQVTRSNEEEWLEDANAFVMDEDEESDQYGVRTTGYDLIGSLFDKWPRPVALLLQDLTTQHIASSASSRGSDPDWWKPLEASLACLGAVGDDVRNLLEDDADNHRPASINVNYLFDEVIPNLLNSSETPFLQGRAFVFASQFASLLSPQLAGQYLSAAVSALEAPDVPVPVKISAVKTIKNFCRFVDAEVMSPQSGKILSMLLPLLPQTDGETLYLLLETIRATLGLDKGLLNAQTTPEVAERVYHVWLQYTQDPVLTAIVEELFESLTTFSPEACRALVLHIAPKLAAAISTPTTDETVHLPGEAIQLANALIRARGEGIEAELVATVTAAILDILQTSDDMDVIQHGVVHLTFLVRKDCRLLAQWHDSHGNSGIACIFRLLGRLLEPSFSESGGIFVGDLIMHLFRKAGDAMGPVLGDLLRAIVQRLASAKTATFSVSLILPFAYLFGTDHTTSVIDLLSSFQVMTPDYTQETGLEVVLSTWCEYCDTLGGSWDIRVSAMGMSKLFTLDDERLRHVMVKGDMVITSEQRNTIMTRSRTKSTPIQYAQIPFPVKALKLILKDVQHVGTKKGSTAAADLELDDDDGDEEWDDDDPLGSGDPADEFAFLSSWLDQGAKNDNAQDDDEDLRADPLAQIDLAQHLTDLLRSSYASNRNGIHEMVESLTEEEKAILRSTLTG